MKISDAAKVSPEFRDYRRCKSLLASIQQRLDYHRTKNTGALKTHHWERYDQACADLRSFNLKALSLRLDSNELIQHTPQSGGTNPAAKCEASQRAKRASDFDGGSVPPAQGGNFLAKDLHAWIWQDLPAPRPAQLNAVETQIVKTMNAKGRRKRAGNYKWEIAAEIAEKARLGWYMIFNTLTVDDENYAAVFSSGEAWADYIRRVDREIATAAYGSIRNAMGEDYHTYFAVTERGTQTKRLHIHVLHFMKALPRAARDPNTGFTRPTRRELDCLRGYWTQGRTSPVMVRYSPEDAYGRANYRWPIDKRTGKGLQVGSPLRVAGYMSKYVTKTYLNQKRKTHPWRVKKSRQFGQAILAELARQLPTRTLIATASQATMSIKMNMSRVPPEQLRLAALREYQTRSQRLPHLSKGLNGYPSFLTLAKSAPPQAGLLQHARASTLNSAMFNPRSSITSPTEISLATVGYDEDWAALKSAAQALDKSYFPRTKHAYGNTSTHDDYRAA